MTDAQIRTLISHAKSPVTALWTLDVPLTLGRLQTKGEKSTNQWAFSPTRGGKGGGGRVGKEVGAEWGSGWVGSEWWVLGWARFVSGYGKDA